MGQVILYDTTLRDGAQGEGIAFSVEDKLRITQKLDEVGIPYIEGGWPGSNPKDIEYFARVRELPLRNATVVAFGMTRRADVSAENDPGLRALLDAGTSVITLVGKSWDHHVTHILRTTLEENLAMIGDSIAFLRGQGRRVFFDAEHFFDGFKGNPEYALRTLQVAEEAGAEVIVLCDTNGGSLPSEVSEIVGRVRQVIKAPLGIHTHNDGELAVANSLVAVQAGVTQVQGTINGIGERCGNANLCSIIPNLQLKLGIQVLTPEQLKQLRALSLFVAERAHVHLSPQQPYVGRSAFTHKAGLHADAVAKWDASYQHVDPALVGNESHIVVSELAGRSNLLEKAREFGIELTPEAARDLLAEIKERERMGYQYDTADASLELLMRRRQRGYRRPFPFDQLDFFVKVDKLRRTTEEKDVAVLAEAVVKFWRPGHPEPEYAAAQGNGPVNALDKALRKLLQAYLGPAAELDRVELRDYRVRVVEGTEGTAAAVRVIIESGVRPNGEDGGWLWATVGCSTNIIEASWEALVDSMEYWLRKHMVEGVL